MASIEELKQKQVLADLKWNSYQEKRLKEEARLAKAKELRKFAKTFMAGMASAEWINRNDPVDCLSIAKAALEQAKILQELLDGDPETKLS